MGRACGDVWVTSYRPPSPPPTKGQRQPVNPTPDPAILDIFKFIFSSCLFCLQQRDKGTCEVLFEILSTLQYNFFTWVTARGERIVFWWPNTNTNIIWLFKNNRIRIRILFGLKKAIEYEYEYYSDWKNRPNTNTNIIRIEKIIKIQIRILVFGLNYSNNIQIPNYSLTSVIDRPKTKTASF